MVENKYGYFNETQLEEYKKKLHDKLFWLLLYKDPKTKDQFPNIDFYQYFEFVMKEISGLNELLLYPEEIVEIMSLLEAAWLETFQDDYDYHKYRKLVLDAHHLVDSINSIKEV